MNVCKVGPLASGIGFFLFLSGAARAQSGQMVNAMDGLCLQVNGPIAAGSRLQIATCTGTPNQLFTKTAANELRMNGNLCVDAYGGGKQAAEVGLWNCQGSPNERWAPNNGMLVTENGFCMAVDGGRRTPGTRIIIYTCYPNDNSQKFSGPVAQRAAVPTPAPTPAPVAAAAQLDPGNLSAACQMVYGRACTVEETAYVRSTPPSTYSTREGIMAFLRTKVTQSAVVRDGLITRAVELTYGPNTQICTEAWDFLRSSFTTNANNQPGSAWNGVNQLYYGNPAMLTSVVTTRCKAAAPRTPGQAFDSSIARAACQTMFGRDCTAEENAQLGSAVGGNNRDAMQAYLRDKIAASPSLKDNVIAAAYAMVMGAGKPICTEEMNDLRARFMSLPQPGTTWNGFAGLAYAAGGSPPLVQARASLCAAPAAARVSSATLSMIAGSYLSDFGRPATTQETTYWASVNPNDPRIASREAFLANNKSFLKSNAAERQATIARAYQATWNVNLPANSKEMQYWDPLVAGGQIVYSGLKRANDLTRTANPNYRPGQSLTVPLNPPANYGLLSAEDSSLRGMLSMLAAALKPFEIMQSGLAKAGDEYLHGPTPPKTASTPPVELAVLPAMRIRNPMNFSGPFILASTYHENPALSFCLDTGSWDAGATVVAVPCHGGDSQLFNVDSSNRIVMAKNAKGLTLCLDGGDKPWPGDPRKKTVVLNTCSNSKTQQWYVNTIPGLRDGTPYVNDFWQRDLNYRSSGQIQNVGNGFCIDIEGGRTGASNPVIAYDCIPRKMGSPRPWNQVWGAGHILQTGAAYVFLRYDPPGPAGHTGWGIQLADGSWEGGTFDGPEEGRIFNIKVPGAVEKGDNNYAWRHHFASEAQLRAYFGEGKIAENPPYRVKGYDRYYKWQLRGTLNTAAAFSLESQSWDWGYGVLGNNCLDVTYKVLRAYGWNLPAPAHSGDIVQYAPKTWFLNLMGGTEPLWLHGQ